MPSFISFLILLMIIGFFGLIYADHRDLWIFAPTESPGSNNLNRELVTHGGTTEDPQMAAAQQRADLKKLRRRTPKVGQAGGQQTTSKRVPRDAAAEVAAKIAEVKQAEQEAAAKKIAAAKLEAAKEVEAKIAEAKIAEAEIAEVKIAEAIKAHKEESAAKIAAAKQELADRSKKLEAGTETKDLAKETEAEQAPENSEVDDSTKEFQVITVGPATIRPATTAGRPNLEQDQMSIQVDSHATEVSEITAEILGLQARIEELEIEDAERTRTSFWEREISAKIESQQLEVETIKIEIGQLTLRVAELEKRHVV